MIVFHLQCSTLASSQGSFHTKWYTCQEMLVKNVMHTSMLGSFFFQWVFFKSPQQPAQASDVLGRLWTEAFAKSTLTLQAFTNHPSIKAIKILKWNPHILATVKECGGNVQAHASIQCGSNMITTPRHVSCGALVSLKVWRIGTVEDEVATQPREGPRSKRTS